jgi:hypothetical protein
MLIDFPNKDKYINDLQDMYEDVERHLDQVPRARQITNEVEIIIALLLEAQEKSKNGI